MGQTLGIVSNEIGVAGLIAVVDVGWSVDLVFGNRGLDADLIGLFSARWSITMARNFGKALNILA